jgi:hypothetical protein
MCPIVQEKPAGGVVGKADKFSGWIERSSPPPGRLIPSSIPAQNGQVYHDILDEFVAVRYKSAKA